MSNETSIKNHIDAFNKIIIDIEFINIKIEDEDKAIILLSSLLNSYESFVDILLYCKKSLRMSDVKSLLNLKSLKK